MMTELIHLVARTISNSFLSKVLFVLAIFVVPAAVLKLLADFLMKHAREIAIV